MDTENDSYNYEIGRHAKLVDWTVYSWFCPNCKGAVAGMKNDKNQIKVKCNVCGAEMIRTVKSRRRDVIEIYAPGYSENDSIKLRRY